MKTNGGTSRLSVNIPPDIVRAVGENARDLVNFCGFVVRTTAPLNVKTWKEAFADAGDRMWRQVQDRFEFKEDMLELEEFAVQTMQHVYRGWKSRLHDHYKLFETNEKRLANPPEDIPMDQWRFCVNRFGSAEFKAMSERNSRNRRKQMTRHTTGPISFAEKEENMRDPITKQLPPADEVWLAEHTRKTKEGEVQWADPRSKEVHEELKVLVTQNSQDTSNPMTQDEMLLHVFGARSGYFRGRGTAKKAYTKANQKALVMQQKQQQQQQQRVTELEKELQDVNDKIEAEQSQREADKNDLREEIHQEIRDEIRQEVRDELRQMFGMLFSGNSLFQSQPTNKGA